MSSLEKVLEGHDPQVLFLSHTELPHAGNTRTIATLWPDITVVVSDLVLPYLELPRYQELKHLVTTHAGTSRSFAGRQFEILNAVLRDQTTSQWIFDPTTKTLLTADAFGYYHSPGQCELFSDEDGGAIRKKDMLDFHRNAFGYLRWVIPERFNDTIDKVFNGHEVETIAPIHGNPISNKVEETIDMLKEIVGTLRMEALDKSPMLVGAKGS